MFEAAPAGLLQINMGADANMLNDLLTFVSDTILKSGKEIFWMRKPSNFSVPGWNELNVQYREAVGHWNIEAVSHWN